MSLERAIDTQRDALLRLLVRLMLVVAVLSGGRFDSALSRWVCRAVSASLSVAEAAAGYLVIASTHVVAPDAQFTPGYGNKGRGKLSAVPCCAVAPEDSVSCAGLLARMRVLKALLENLSRHALRLVRREAAYGYAGTLIEFSVPQVAGFSGGLCRLPRIERPPDKIISKSQLG